MIEELEVKCERHPIVFIPEVIYAQGYVNMHCVNAPLRLSLMMPVTPQKMPLIVWLEGGSWRTQNEQYAVPELVYLAEAGYAVAFVQYRSSSQCPFPGQIRDAKAAIRFLRANADRFYLDENRIGVMGRSAGGTVASMLAMEDEVTRGYDVGDHMEYSSEVSAVISMYAINNFHTLYDSLTGSIQAKAEAISNVETYLGTYGNTNDALMKKASPFYHINQKTKPHLLIHGTKDTFVPVVQSVDFYNNLRGKKVSAKLLLLNNGGHGSEEFDQLCVKERILQFLHENV